MEWVNVLLTVITGLLLRFAIPIGMTVLLVLWLRWLDSRWLEQAERSRMMAANALHGDQSLSCHHGIKALPNSSSGVGGGSSIEATASRESSIATPPRLMLRRISA